MLSSFLFLHHKAMGVDTKLPEESDTGIEYPRYNELSKAGYDWPGRDHVFIHKELFDQMAKGQCLLKWRLI